MTKLLYLGDQFGQRKGKGEIGERKSETEVLRVRTRDRVSSQPTPYHEAKPSNAPLISHWIYVGEN